jgi:phage repressor protein C with HTH and peptisase S24 domain/transcriptional regulator with XRE-family HTH domain
MAITMLEPLGTRIRRQRRRHGLTLDDLSARTGISKPYLSLIETGRVANPPSDEKLRRIEMELQFTPGELLTEAQLLRTPKEVRAMLKELVHEEGSERRVQESGFGVQEKAQVEGLISDADDSPRCDEVAGADADANERESQHAIATIASASSRSKKPARTTNASHVGLDSIPKSELPNPKSASSNRKSQIANRKSQIPTSLDSAYLSGLLQQIAERQGSNIDAPMRTQGVPVINRVSAGYPKDFTDLSYPKGVADSYVVAPDVYDVDAFAARVFGDSMSPRYRPGDIVVFSPAAPFSEGADCFVRFDDGQTTFKRVYTETPVDGVERLRLVARNPKYPPRIVDAEKVTGVYRAVCRYETLDAGE